MHLAPMEPAGDYTFSGDQSDYIIDVAFNQLDESYTGGYNGFLRNCQDYCPDFRKKIE